MYQEKYSLTWHTYSDHLKRMMKALMINEDFSDVTLVTEDKMQIKAHINILSACSPVFRDILKKDKNSSTVMYLRGIQFSEMESIMQYIYLGEATFYEEKVDELIAVAKSLEIKELCNAEHKANDEPDDELAPSDPVTGTEMIDEQNDTSDHTIKQDSQISKLLQIRREVLSVNRKYECDMCHKKYSDKRGLDRHRQSVHEGVLYVCDQCDYQARQQSHLTKHIQSKHEGVQFQYACDQCDFLTAWQSHLAVHIQSKHEGIKYACDQCDYQVVYKNELTRHIQTRHEGVKYACDQCDYQATNKSNLTKHIQSKHEGIKYACDKCDYQAVYQHHLAAHIQSKHEGVKYACDQCDYQFTQTSSLIRHIKRAHKAVHNQLSTNTN